MILNMKDGPSEEDRKLAYGTKVNKNAHEDLESMKNDGGHTAEDMEHTEEEALLLDKVNAARDKIIAFNMVVTGLTAVHPSMDPHDWRPPHGHNSDKPLVNPCQQDLKEVVETEETMTLDYLRLCNKCQHHKCLSSYCLKRKKKTKDKTKDKDSKDVKNSKDDKDKEGEQECRFRFPKAILGFEPEFVDKASPTLMESCKRMKDKDTGECVMPKCGDVVFLDDKELFELVRNNPSMNEHIRELLSIHRANIDARRGLLLGKNLKPRVFSFDVATRGFVCSP